MENVTIIGSGIAGLTAAVYNARANLNPIVVVGKAEGGQLMLTTVVANYPCFPEGIMGPEMISKAREQAKKFGAKFVDGDVEKVQLNRKSFITTTNEGKIESKAVIVATGATAKTLGLDSEKKYWAKGVHTCAVCDGYFYQGKEIIVIGGGDSAMEESLFLTRHASKVTIIHRRDKFRASKIMQDRVFANKKISIVLDSVVEEVLGGDNKVTAVKIKNVKSDEVKCTAARSAPMATTSEFRR